MSTSWTGCFPAKAAASPQTCPSSRKTGSMRIEPYAMWLEDMHTGTSRFVHSSRRGVRLRYEMG